MIFFYMDVVWIVVLILYVIIKTAQENKLDKLQPHEVIPELPEWEAKDCLLDKNNERYYYEGATFSGIVLSYNLNNKKGYCGICEETARFVTDKMNYTMRDTNYNKDMIRVYEKLRGRPETEELREYKARTIKSLFTNESYKDRCRKKKVENLKTELKDGNYSKFLNAHNEARKEVTSNFEKNTLQITG